MRKVKSVYISGPITGINEYWEPFDKAEDDLTSRGFTVLSPARLPEGLTKEQYMRIDLAMIDSADVVLFLPEFFKSVGARLEWQYCQYICKPCVYNLDTLDEVRL